MNNKIILATSGLADAESLLNSINDLIIDTSPLIIEASIFTQHSLNAFPDTRTMQEARDLAFDNTEHFEKICINRKIHFARRPHYDNYFIKDLIEDSRFADLIVCSANFLANDHEPGQVKEGVKALLRKVECPILLLPENLKSLRQNDLFVFDGSVDSIHAVKSYTYLFPHRCNREILIHNCSPHGTAIAEITTWLSAHYYRFRWLKQLPANDQHNFVCGSLARASLANPVFIFHR